MMKNHRRISTLVVAAFAAVVFSPVMGQAQQAAPAAPAAAVMPVVVGVGSPIGEFSLTDADGKGVSEKTLAGKPTALVFFQTACSMCAAEVQDVREIAGRNPGFNIVLVSIDMRPPADKFKSYRKNYAGDTAPIWLDSKLALGRRLKLSATPAVALIDSKGNLAELNIGYSAGEKNTLEQSLKNLK